MAVSEIAGLIPLSEATLRLGMNRDRLIRRIQEGRIEGHLIAGRWLVSEQSVTDATRRAEKSA